jgi:hypothetical protein
MAFATHAVIALLMLSPTWATTTTGEMVDSGTTTTAGEVDSSTVDPGTASSVVSFLTAFVGIDFSLLMANATALSDFKSKVGDSVAQTLAVPNTYINITVSELAGRRLVRGARRLTGAGVNALTEITIPQSSNLNPDSIAASVVDQANTLSTVMINAAKDTTGMSSLLHSGVDIDDLSASVDVSSVTVTGDNEETSSNAAQPAIGLGSALLAAVVAVVASPVS